MVVVEGGCGGQSGHITVSVCVHAKSFQLCLTLCDPIDCIPPGSSVRGLSRQEYWSGLPCPPPGDLLTQG